VFHVPVNDWPAGKELNAKNRIEGLVHHKPISGNPVFAYGMLLWLYDRNEFFVFAGKYGKLLRTRAQHKWKMVFNKVNNTVEGWCKYFGVTKDAADDLPF
jgi:hypothetical protein